MTTRTPHPRPDAAPYLLGLPVLVVPAVATFGLALTDDDLIALVLVTVAIVVVQLWLPRRWRDRTGLL